MLHFPLREAEALCNDGEKWLPMIASCFRSAI